jgi:hypothetical protein
LEAGYDPAYIIGHHEKFLDEHLGKPGTNEREHQEHANDFVDNAL